MQSEPLTSSSMDTFLCCSLKVVTVFQRHFTVTSVKHLLKIFIDKSTFGFTDCGIIVIFTCCHLNRCISSLSVKRLESYDQICDVGKCMPYGQTTRLYRTSVLLLEKKTV